MPQCCGRSWTSQPEFPAGEGGRSVLAQRPEPRSALLDAVGWFGAYATSAFTAWSWS
ncbi:hypothetical protein SGPA1_41210 [Streptomyces misionensis JCM 4497]